MLACDCLNVIIEPESNDFLQVTKDLLELTETEKKDSFFNQEIQQIQKLHKITKKISGLVATRLIGSRWVVHQCLNCNVHSHAIHRDRGAAYVLVSCKLLNKEAIAEIKKSPHYSPIFDIKILDHNSNKIEHHLENITSSESETVISGLKQKLNEFINRETVATEERIRRYTEDQFKALNDFRDRAFQEHHILQRRVLEHKLNTADDNEPSTNLSRSNLTSRSPARSVPENVASANSPLDNKSKQSVNNKSPTKKLSSSPRLSNRIRSNTHSFDSEMFFPLEDMDDISNAEQEESDQDEDEEVFSDTRDENSEPVQRPKQPSQLAKSLPVNIPVFMSAFRNHVQEDNDDERPDECMDIAASIKALAKSIQGGTVFGELPRPRFSSQI